MTSRRALLFLGAALLAGAALRAGEAPVPVSVGPAKPAATLPLSPRFKQVRERVDALFALRNQAPAAPDPATNPFRTNVPVVAAAPEVAPPVIQVTGDLALLQQIVASLKITGVVERGGEMLVSVNSRLYRKGEIVQGQALDVRVKDIAGRVVILALNEAEMTLKF